MAGVAQRTRRPCVPTRTPPVSVRAPAPGSARREVSRAGHPGPRGGPPCGQTETRLFRSHGAFENSKQVPGPCGGCGRLLAWVGRSGSAEGASAQPGPAQLLVAGLGRQDLGLGLRETSTLRPGRGGSQGVRSCRPCPGNGSLKLPETKQVAQLRDSRASQAGPGRPGPSPSPSPSQLCDLGQATSPPWAPTPPLSHKDGNEGAPTKDCLGTPEGLSGKGD